MLRLTTTKSADLTEYKLWFNDHDNDLFIWLDQNENPTGFQFCYDKSFDEHSINWQQQKGFSHARIDAGEACSSRYKMIPIMLPDGVFKYRQVAELFRSISAHIDHKLADFVYHKICTYPDYA
jgi:hypothetical protein